MNGLSLLVAVLVLIASASASSIFSGGDVKPDNNPIVNKYHTGGDLDHVAKRLAVYIVIGALGAIVMFISTMIYYTYRFCRTRLCCCIKACRVNKTRARSDSLEREMRNANPVVSWILRIVVILLFLLVLILVAVGFVATTEVHKNIVETTSTLDKTASDLNRTIYHTDYTVNNLIDVNVTQETLDDLKDLMNSTNTLADEAHYINTVAPHVDGIRNNTAMATYVVVLIPLLIGLIGAIIGRGRLTAIMSVILPWLIISFWVLFAFHYSMFQVNVDVCYVIDDILTTNYTDPDTGSTTSGMAVFDCSDYTSSAAPLLAELDFFTNLTNYLISNTTDEALKLEYTNQLYNLQNITVDVADLANCSRITNIMNIAYPDICGKAISASLFLWRSQVSLAIVLLVTMVVGLVAEYRIVPRNSKKKDDYSTLALLN